jgi:hypothetical protein
MQRLWVDGFAIFRIAGEEASGIWVVVSGAEVIEAEV